MNEHAAPKNAQRARAFPDWSTRKSIKNFTAQIYIVRLRRLRGVVMLLCLSASLWPLKLKAECPCTNRVSFDGVNFVSGCIALFKPTDCSSALHMYVDVSCNNFTGTLTWKIEPALGLKLRQDTGWENWLDPLGSFQSVEDGTLTVTAVDDNGKQFTGQVEVRLHEESVCSGSQATSSDDNSQAPCEPPCLGGPVGPGSTPTPPGTPIPPPPPPTCGTDNAVSFTVTENRSVATFFNLGRYAFGKRAGGLSIKEANPTNLLTTPSCLNYLFDTSGACQVITNTAGIRQIKAPEGLADVVTNTLCRYYIYMYPASAVGGTNSMGYYTNTGPPLTTITVENPNTNMTSWVRVSDGYGLVSDYCWCTNGWILTNGAGFRKEYKTSVWSDSNTVRTTTVEVRNDTNGLLSCLTRKHQVFSFGEKLIETTQGDGSNILTNSYSYYTNGYATGLLQQVTFATGPWETYEFDTNKLATNKCFSFLNQGPTTNGSLCRMFSYAYGSNAVSGAGDKGTKRPAEPRCTVEYLSGHEIGRTYLLVFPDERREIRCVTPGSTWNSADNLVSVTRWYTNGINTNRLWTLERPDGTMDIYQYAFYTNGSGAAFRTNVVLTGAPDANKTNILDGKKTTTVVGSVGQMISRTVIDIASGITMSDETYSDYDSYNRPKKVAYLDGTFRWTDYGCCGPTTETNREGTVVYYHQDVLRRYAARTMNNISSTNVLDAAGRLLSRIRVGSDASAIVQATNTYDTAGRRLSSRDAFGNTTTYSESITNSQLFRTATYPDGGTRVETDYRDGELAKVTGTAVHPIRYEYGVVQDGSVWRRYTKEIKLDGNGNDTAEALTNLFDMVGRLYKTSFADGALQQYVYNIKGQLEKQVDPDGVTSVYAYNAKGERVITAADMDRNGIIGTNGTDRVQLTVQKVTLNGGVNVLQTTAYAWFTNNSSVSNLVSTSETSADGLRTWQSRIGLTNRTWTKYAGNGNRYMTNTAPDGAFTIAYYSNGLVQSVTRKDSSGNQLGQTTYSYDAHGRTYTVTDARNGASTYSYDNADRVTSTTSHSPGNGQGAQTTAYSYDWAGRTLVTTLSDGTSVTNEYQFSGELKKAYGSQTYPVQHAYDAQGRRTNMTTWKNFAADSGKATTTWKYDGYRGFLTNKVYDDGKGPFYGYTPAGRLRTRTWARGVTTTYVTNALGEVLATTYSDGTPAVTNNFDRMGHTTNIVDGAGSRSLAYNAAGQVLNETNNSGTLIGGNLRFTYDQYLRRTNHQLFATNTSLLNHSFGFDAASRLTNASDGSFSGGYSFLANSPLISQITYRASGATRMTTTKSYDKLNRLTAISSQPGAAGAGPVSFNYTYNDANQRTRVSLEDGSFWIYQYDKLGQVTSGKRYWSDWTPVAGQQFEYSFDDIGNRTSTKAGGDANGGGLLSANYSANSLNQYTSRDVPGAVDILGIAHANATVTVNGQSPYRRGEYFWQELSLNNSSAAVCWTNKWDGENRLVDITSLASGPSASRKSLQFAYDWQGRRYSKIVSNWTGSTWTRALHELYLYDGWNLLAALNGTNQAIVKSFLWGLDLSGSMQGAGGVGGLIAFASRQSPVGSYFVAYDGNGNVMALVDGSSGSLSARYEYDPFGQTIRCSGTLGTLNPVRFSSKHLDDETDLVYYGYRYLTPNAGKWLSRDPIGERGGKNLWQFVHGAPVNAVDPLGKDTYICDAEISLNHNFGPYTEPDGACTISSLIIPYGYRCFRDGTNDRDNVNNFYTAIQVKTRKTRQCPCQAQEDLGETYYNCTIPGPPGVFIQPTLRDFASTFSDPGSATDFGSKFCDGAIAAFGN